MKFYESQFKDVKCSVDATTVMLTNRTRSCSPAPVPTAIAGRHDVPGQRAHLGAGGGGQEPAGERRSDGMKG